MRIIFRIIIFYVFTAILLFNNCTTKYSNPYSAGNVAKNLSRQYSVEIEIIEVKKKKFFDGRKFNEYLLKDKSRDFLFEAGSYIKMDRHIILYDKERWDHYSRDLMRHYHDDVMRIADKYAILLIPPLQELPEVYSKADSPVRPFDSVFIHSPEQLDIVIDLYIELAHFYNFSYIRYHKNETRNPKLILSYLPGNEADRNKSTKICHLPYLEYRVDKDDTAPYSYGEKEKYVNYIPEKDEVRKKLYQSWNDAVNRERIVQKRVEYKEE
jgi:hypothetical protein